MIRSKAKHLMAALFAVASIAAAVAPAQAQTPMSANGVLYTNGTQGYDFVYPGFPGISPNQLKQAGAKHVFQARFKMTGTGPVTGDEHQLVGLTQGEVPSFTNSPFQVYKGWGNQKLFTYGVGAFVRNDGLSIEGWTGNGTAVYLGNHHGRCMVHVPTEATDCSIALNRPLGDYNLGFWHDHRPGVPFVFNRANAYWVVFDVSNPTGGPTARMHAKLFEEGPNGVSLVQEAGVLFTIDAFLPYNAYTKAVVGRTQDQGAGNIGFDAFNH